MLKKLTNELLLNVTATAPVHGEDFFYPLNILPLS